MADFAEILKRRRVRRVAWFHCDHWEPWSRGINESGGNRVREFIRRAKRSRLANKSTLFYLDGRGHRLADPSQPLGVSVEGDVVELLLRSEDEDRRAVEAVGAVRAETGVEFQVHIHHEHLTYNDGDWTPAHRAIKRHTSRELDQRRMRLLIELSLASIRRDTGLTLERWAFIHGNWALNGSDREVCQIDNELSLLMEYGCWGDFSFPAGQPHCDPLMIEHPYTCVPVLGLNSHDYAACAPLPVVSGVGAIRPDRFFIWNSRAKHETCSVDCYGPYNTERVTHHERIVSSWLHGSPVIGDVLYLKTHSHSMDFRYYADGYTIPLEHPDIVGMFDMLQRACDTAKIEFQPCTLSEAMAQLQETDSQGAPAVPPSWLTQRATRVDDTLDATAVNDLLVPVAAAWVAQHPEYERGVGEYYREKLTRGDLIGEGDRAIADYCARVFPNHVRFLELGFGFGEISLLLALKGFAVIGFDGEKGRYEAARALVSALEERRSSSLPLALVYGVFPDALREEMLAFGKNVLVCTNLTSSHIMKNFDAVMASLAEFDHIVMDITRFGTERDETSQTGLILRMMTLGYSEVVTVMRHDGPDIRHFSRYRTDPVRPSDAVAVRAAPIVHAAIDPSQAPAE